MSRSHAPGAAPRARGAISRTHGASRPRISSITNGPVPKHVQLSERLQDLAVHQLEPGAALPSERDLMTTYGVSRTTVRRAIDTLVAAGLLHREAAKGTYVGRPRMESTLQLASFSQDMRRRGLTPSTRLLRIDQGHPPAEVRIALALAPRQTAWRVHRVRLADGEPIADEQGWYPLTTFPDLDVQDLSGSLYALFAERYGAPVENGEQTVWSECAESEVARRLETAPNTPLLVLRRVSTSGGRPVEYVVSRYRADRYQVHMTLTHQPRGSD